ncbi:MAG: ABC transporter ATP-binding protein [Muribaculaceae bacterium]|nr:ABC transporter ATP-binding protein [Muribaculaceae bacterium]
MDIKITNLKKVYDGVTVLDISDLTLASGELIGLVGNNGAGKTTLMRLILDVIGASSGFVESDGRRVDQDELWKTYTGSFIDGNFLIDFFTPEEYFSFIGRIYGIDNDTLQQCLKPFEPLMHGEIMGTSKFLKDFSQGNRQKVGIIGAMMIQPKVLILDEPFNYLDPSSQIIVARLIEQQNRELGSTVLISSHNLSFVTDISSRILLLEKGVVVKDLDNHGRMAEGILKAYFQEQDPVTPPEGQE